MRSRPGFRWIGTSGTLHVISLRHTRDLWHSVYIGRCCTVGNGFGLDLCWFSSTTCVQTVFSLSYRWKRTSTPFTIMVAVRELFGSVLDDTFCSQTSSGSSSRFSCSTRIFCLGFLHFALKCFFLLQLLQVLPQAGQSALFIVWVMPQ